MPSRDSCVPLRRRLSGPLPIVIVSGVLAAAAWWPTESIAQTPGLVEFFAGNQLRRGLKLVDLQTESVVIGRDGWLYTIDAAKKETALRPVTGSYEPITGPELRNELRAEFGPPFEVLATPNFLVVQPTGRGRTWPDLFEQSHRAFVTYMQKRGVKVRQGRFPMVAIVFPDRRAMYAEFKKLDIDATRVAGLYSNNSNRVMTHDGGDPALIAATVRHEAAHQSAFNSGVHSRVNDTPQWISEGIGQMFEPPAMADTRSTSRLEDRLNRDSLRVISRRYGRGTSPALASDVADLIGSDAMFADPRRVDDAYAVSWAMMFFLAERQPEIFADLLNFTSTRPPFHAYLAGQRRIDFERISGLTIDEFARQVGWFLDRVQ